MALYHKIFIHIFVASFLLPVLVFAQSEDFLVIAGTLKNGVISVDSIEQRIFDRNDVNIYQLGLYEAKILKGNKVTSNNFFEIVEGSEVWIDVKGDRPEEKFKSSEASFRVVLPANKDINLDATLEILKGGNLLFSQKLSTLPVDIITAQNPISEKESNKQNLFIYIALAIGAAVVAWFVWKLLRAKRGVAGLPQ